MPGKYAKYVPLNEDEWRALRKLAKSLGYTIGRGVDPHAGSPRQLVRAVLNGQVKLLPVKRKRLANLKRL